MNDDWRRWVPRDLEWIHKPFDFEWRRDPPDIQATNPFYSQVNFRLRDDSTALNTDGGWLATENQTGTTVRGTGIANRFRVRFTTANNNNRSGTQSNPNIQYAKNSGSYVPIGASTDQIRSTDGLPTDDDLCSTQLLGSPGEGAFEPDGGYDDIDGSASDWTHEKEAFSEVEFCVYIIDDDVVDGDVFEFQVWTASGTTNSWNGAAKITVTKPTGPQITGDVTVGVTVASVMAYTRNAAIVGAITVALAVGFTGAAGPIIPDAFDEQFENPAGTDETWSAAVTLTGGATMGYDQATGAVTGAPADWSEQCSKLSYSTGETCQRLHDLGVDYPISYFRGEFIIESESLANGQRDEIFWIYDNSGNKAAVFLLGQDGTEGLRIEADIAHASVSPTLYTFPIALDTRYRIEFYWNQTADEWEWKVDGVTQDSGSLTGGQETKDINRFYVGTWVAQAGNVFYVDNIAVNTTDWIGPATDAYPNLWNEKFETDPGYDESWYSETAIGGGILDEDYPTSSVTGAPSSWDVLCLRAVTVTDGDNDLNARIERDYPIAYVRYEFIVETQSLADGQDQRIASIFDSGANTIVHVGIKNDSGGFGNEIEIVDYHLGTSTYLEYPLTLGVRNYFELYWNTTANEYEYRLNEETPVSGALSGSAVDSEVDRLRIGVSASGADFGMEAFWDAVGISTMGWMGPSELGGSSFEYKDNPVEHVIAGDVTVGVTVGSIAGITPDTFNERFEASPGYDETWSEPENVGGSSTLDEDWATSGVAGAPRDWGDDCLKLGIIEGEACYVKDQEIGNLATAYMRFELIVESHSFGTYEHCRLFALSDSIGQLNVLFDIETLNDPNVVYFALTSYHDGAQSYWSDPLALDRRYRVETKWDTATDTWGWKIDGVIQDSGSLEGTAATRLTDRIEVGGAGVFFTGDMVAYLDNIALDVTEWIGPTPFDSTEYTGTGAQITGDVTVGVTVAGAMEFALRAELAGAVTVGVDPTAGALDYNRHAAITGAIPVTIDPTASALDYARNADLTGAVTVGIDSTASALEFQQHPSLTGAVPVAITVAGALDYTRNADLAGAVAVTVDPTASALDYTRNADITGDVTVVVTSAAAFDYTLNASIDGAITVVPSVASAMEFSGASQYAIVGAVPVAVTVAAGLDYTRNAAIDGDVTVGVTVASAMEFSGVLHYTIVGAVPVTVTVAAGLDYTRNADITGAVTVAVDPTASALEFQQHPEIAGAVTVAVAVASAMDYTLDAAIAGDVTVAVTVASGMVYEAPGKYTIVGNVPVAVTIAGAFDYTLNADLTGAITVGVAPTATLAYNRNADITGTVTVSVDPTATALEYNRNPSIDGAITVSPTVAAGFDYTRHADLTGDVTVAVTVASDMAYATEGALVGDITVVVTPSATFIKEKFFAGDVTVTVTPASGMDYTRNAAITGDVTVGIAVASGMEFANAYTITGDVTVGISVASAMEYTSSNAIVGDVTVTVTPAAAFDYTLSAEIAGSVDVGIAIASGMSYNTAGGITGDITVDVSVASPVEYNRNADITGDVTVSIAVASATEFANVYTIVGDTTVIVTIDSPTRFTFIRGITGDITVGITVASFMQLASGVVIVGCVRDEAITTSVASELTITSIAEFLTNDRCE